MIIKVNNGEKEEFFSLDELDDIIKTNIDY